MKTLLVDDEPLALRRLEHLAAEIGGIDIVASCKDGPSAIEAANKFQPDLVLLDIKMPGPDGFEVAAQLNELTPLPEIVFVTAFDHFAVHAFETHALDYLLKPVEKDRLADTFHLARERIKSREKVGRADELGAIIQDLREALGEHQRDENKRALWVKEKGRMVRISNADINWIQAERDYIRLHVGDRSHLMRHTMAAISKTLDPEKFVRAHRSAIVNVSTVRQLRLSPTGAHILRLNDGTEIPVGRHYRSAVAEALQTKA